MPSTHKTYSFTLILSGAREPTGKIQDALFEAGCDDALLGSRGGVLYLDFDREAATLGDAVLSAIGDVERSGAGLQVVRVEFSEMVTAGEIAGRIGQTRESIRLYALGKRGPGGFPAPVARLRSRSPLYRWSDVAGWLANVSVLEPGQVAPDADDVELINATLGVRRLAPAVPKAMHVFQALGVPELGTAIHPLQEVKLKPPSASGKKKRTPSRA